MKPFVAISGTSRPDNYTAHALAIVVKAMRDEGADVRVFDAREMTLPFPGQEATADSAALLEVVSESQGVVIATPEYHGSYAAMTKLIIENLGFPSVLKGRPVALVGVAAGRIGAIKSIEQLRATCAHTGAVVMPGAVSVAGVRSVFEADGTCTDPAIDEALAGLGSSLLEYVKDFVCPRHALEAMVREGGAPWHTTV